MEEFKHRTLTEEILKHWNNKAIHIIKGPRRAGKTMLLKHLHSLKGGSYISFEDPAERSDFISSPINYIKQYEQPIFLDEIQLLGQKGGYILKWIYDELHDKGLKLVISGSGAFDVKMGLTSALVGRAYFYELLPLSFKEYLIWKKPSLLPIYKKGHEILQKLLKGKKAEEMISSMRLENLFKEYLIYGGYPEVVLKRDKKELVSIINTTIEEDIFHYFNLKDSIKIWNVVRKLGVFSGNILDVSALGVDYRTAEHYISILSYSYIIKELTTFSTNKLLELTKSKKLYFYDIGFRNGLLNKFQPYELRDDIGVLMEMFMFRQLFGQEIHYWRTKNKAEVDFIILKEKNIIPIEVKSGKGHTTRSLFSFINRYKPRISIVVGFEPRVLKEEPYIFAVPPYYF